MPLPPPGWLADPAMIGVERYWDGERWTVHTRDAVTLVEGTAPAWRPPVAVGGPSEVSGAQRPHRPGVRPRAAFSWARVFRSVALVCVLGAVLVVVDTPLSRALRDSGALPEGVPVAVLDVASVASVDQVPDVEPEAAEVAYPLAGSTSLVRYLEAAMIAREEKIDVRFWTQEPGGTALIDDAMREAMTQNPYLFVMGWQALTANRTITSVEPTYVYDAAETQRRQEATLAAVDKALALTPLDGLSEASQVRAIHAYVASVATYDYAASDLIDADSTDPRIAESQEAYGILVGGTAVCNGYAQAFKAIADAAGLSVVTVTGDAWNGMTSGAHAWNRVLVDGEWLTVDVTWDDGGDPAPVYEDYLLLPADSPLLDTRAADDEWMVDAGLGAYGG